MEKFRKEVETILWSLIAEVVTEMFRGNKEYGRIVQNSASAIVEKAPSLSADTHNPNHSIYDFMSQFHNKKLSAWEYGVMCYELGVTAGKRKADEPKT